tara:strand:+ start:18541 stop:19380 length:840 start_codon:yes stop_codon:yes gene_type:complete
MPDDSVIWLDGATTRSLPLPDRGLDFGDGVFETLLLINAKPLFLPLHLDRLSKGLQALRFPHCMALVEEHLVSACHEVASLGWRHVALRLSVTRGAGPRGYTPPRESQPRIVMQASRLLRDPTQMASPAVLGEGSIRLASQPALAGLKHLNRLEQVLGALDAREQGVDEVLLLGQSGDVVSVAAGNVFILRGDHLLTPSLVDCGIHGTRRRLVLTRWASSLGFRVAESKITRQDVIEADEVFYTNAIYGLRSVAAFGHVTWRDHPVGEAIFNLYLGEIQ